MYLSYLVSYLKHSIHSIETYSNSGSLMKAIDDFLRIYPSLHSVVLKNLQEAMSE